MGYYYNAVAMYTHSKKYAYTISILYAESAWATINARVPMNNKHDAASVRGISVQIEYRRGTTRKYTDAFENLEVPPQQCRTPNAN